MRHPQRGFTMVEMIVVLVVIAVMATIAVPRLMDNRALQEMGFQDQLHAMLRHARKTAVSQQRSVCVNLVAGAVRQAQSTYAASTTSCAGTAVTEPGGSDPFVIAIPASLTFSGVTAVRFDANGRPVNPANGGVTLAADQIIIVGARALRVSRETGFAYWP